MDLDGLLPISAPPHKLPKTITNPNVSSQLQLTTESSKQNTARLRLRPMWLNPPIFELPNQCYHVVEQTNNTAEASQRASSCKRGSDVGSSRGSRNRVPSDLSVLGTDLVV